jgi:hypothetical protein
MKRLLTIVVALSCLALPLDAFATGGEYGFVISASAASPDVNTVPFAAGVQTYFLWLKCCNLPAGFPQGISAAEFGLVSTNAANLVLGFTPTGSWLNAGGASNLLLAVGGCPCGPTVAGSILILANAPGSLCIGPSSTNTKAGVDCSPDPQLWPIEWRGLDFGGGIACVEGTLCEKPPLAVEEASWGGVKALYR